MLGNRPADVPVNLSHAHKRHFQDHYESQRNVKRRLLDNLTSLSLGGNPNSAINTKTFNKTNSLFGTYSKTQLHQSFSDPNKVYIKNIDQFLRENTDQLDITGQDISIDDLRKKGLDTLYVSCGLDLNKAWEKIMDQYRSEDYENKSIDDHICKLIWDDYVSKYFSLITYYDPARLLWTKFLQWFNRNNRPMFNHPNITELDNDGDDIMADANINIENSNDHDDCIQEENELRELASREQSIRDGMSSYGSYYHHDDDFAWNSNQYSGDTNMITFGSTSTPVDDGNNDVMMED